MSLSRPTSAPRKTFGRVGRVPMARSVVSARPALGGMPEVAAFEARYTARMNWLGLALIYAGYQAAGEVMGVDQTTLIDATGFDTNLMFGASILMALIGAVWIVLGLTGTRALAIDHRGVYGFTLLGTKFIAWPDIDRIEHANDHENYGRTLRIHAKRSSMSGSYLWLNEIPLYLDRIDRGLDEVLEALRAGRPDLYAL